MPGLADRPDFRSFLATALAAIRGLAVLEFLDRGEEVARMWPGYARPAALHWWRTTAADPPRLLQC